MRALYGWQSAESLVGQDVQFRRFMMVDGYGRDTIAITFERRPGHVPRLSIEVPRSERGEGEWAGPADTPLMANLDNTEWQRVLRLTEQFDEKLASERGNGELTEDGGIVICLHSWVTVLEAGDPAPRRLLSPDPDKLRSDTEDACSGGLAIPAAFELAEVAYEILGECHGLDPIEYRNRVMQLAHCKRLGGDRLAAVEAAVMVNQLEDAISGEGSKGFEPFFHYNNRELADHFATVVQGASLYLGSPYAVDRNNAYVLGSLHPEDQPTDDERAYRFANVRLELQGDGDSWRIVSYDRSDLITVPYED